MRHVNILNTLDDYVLAAPITLDEVRVSSPMNVEKLRVNTYLDEWSKERPQKT